MLRIVTFLIILNFLSPIRADDLSVHADIVEQKYKRAMVLGGGGLQTAMFLGILREFRDEGLAPELIIATCGGALAAAIAHSLESSEERLAYISSKFFYQILQEGNFGSNGRRDSMPLFKPLWWITLLHTKYKFRRIIPDIFTKYMISYDPTLSFGLPLDDFRKRTHRTVLLATRLLFEQKETERLWEKDRKYFQLTLFTDSQTGHKIREYRPPLGAEEGSLIHPKADIKTGISFEDALNAALSESFILPPYGIGEEWYIHGGPNLYPLELAKELAHEVVMIQNKDFDLPSKGAIQALYNIDIMKRQRKVFLEGHADYLVHAEDIPKDILLTPTLNWWGGKVITRIPDNYEDYLKIIEKQYNFGRAKAKKAILEKMQKDSWKVLPLRMRP